MKDNKYTPYILGPMLLLVWGLVFYKIYQAVYGTEVVYTIPNFGILPVYQTIPQDSNYVLLLNYADPFLGKAVGKQAPIRGGAQKRSIEVARPVQRVVPPSKAPAASFPEVLYQGYQVLEGDTIALLKVNGRFYPMARLGGVYQGVTVQVIYGDSIGLYFEGQQQVFTR